ncbi:ATP-binding protein [Arthrobacter sp. Ld5]|uniref:ATP-binding protein n=1 Tax=Arthrobacter sp. Ld5 TaxID=649152 RepID=UPI003EBD1F3B
MEQNPHANDSSAEATTLATRISASRGGQVAHATLRTDEKVLARVTDGIYREPSSALRELISNAYDADATEVTIQTDRPRFSRITVTDNGNGMTPDVLAHLINHIGGSAKRSDRGKHLNVTDRENRFLSPGGRRLIGRIGIGLFSVSQLTHSFQIVTKTKGDEWRTIAVVRLKPFEEEGDNSSAATTYEAGRVSIWQVPAADVQASGTTIILSDLKDSTISTLSSRGRWRRIRRTDEAPPTFHIGEVAGGKLVEQMSNSSYDSLPWGKDDDPKCLLSTGGSNIVGE